MPMKLPRRLVVSGSVVLGVLLLGSGIYYGIRAAEEAAG
jgi:hypothetical protein